MASTAKSNVRIQAVVVAVGVVLLAIKFTAWSLTRSNTILSDALESIVNVTAGAFALYSLWFAAQPRDREHPYGHGKIEYMSAAFEGGLVSFAAVAILVTGVRTLLAGPELRQLDLGLAVTAGAGVVNLALGAWLVRQGRRLGSPALVADGRHVLSDVWTTLGVLVGLALVRLTGLTWLDPVAAILVGLLLARTGIQLVRKSAGSLLDEGDPALIEKLCRSFDQDPVPGVVLLHQLRAIHAGNAIHVDAHAYVPEHWTVQRAHEVIQLVEERLLAATGLEGDLALHLDPCRRSRCEECDLEDCPVRQRPLQARRRTDVQLVTGPPPPPLAPDLGAGDGGPG